MKIVVEALNLRVAGDSRTAGVARLVVQLTRALAEHPEVDAVRIFLDRATSIPKEFDGLSKLDIRIVNKFRTHYLMDGPKARFAGFRAALMPVLGETPPKGLLPIPVTNDVFSVTHPEWFDADAAERMSRGALAYLDAGHRHLAISEATKREMEKLRPGIGGRTRVIRLGPGNVEPRVSPDAARTALGDLPFAKSPFLFTISTVEPRKNMARLVEAFDSLAEAFPDLHLVVAGGKGWGESDAQARAERSPHRARIHFLGYVDDDVVPALFGACRLAVIPSLDEGFGLPILEAMHYGAPIVSSGAGAMREVGGDVPRYFDPLSATDMASVLGDALKDLDWQRESIVRGAARSEEFTWSAAAEDVVAGLKAWGLDR